MPTDVPVGAAPRPIAPLSVRISTSTAGRHLQSMICCAFTETILSAISISPYSWHINDVEIAQIGAGIAGEDGGADGF